MAMLVLPEVFQRTWSIATEPFWPRATSAVRAAAPDFVFMAEVYWDLEWTLQHQGFDFTYDKRLYDRLEHGSARPVREHLYAGLDFQDRLARFLENHDEPRAAATFPPERHRAAAVITFLAPGLRFFHQGQREGKRVRIPMHLGRGPAEPPDAAIGAFYEALLACLRQPAYRDGQWQLLGATPAWEGNESHEAFIAYAWSGRGDARHLVVANYADHHSQCLLPLPWPELAGHVWRLQDGLSARDVRPRRRGTGRPRPVSRPPAVGPARLHHHQALTCGRHHPAFVIRPSAFAGMGRLGPRRSGQQSVRGRPSGRRHQALRR